MRAPAEAPTALCIPSACGVRHVVGATLKTQHIPQPLQQRLAVQGGGLPDLGDT